MNESVIEDAREQIIPLFIVDGEEASVNWDSRKFLGTAFFVTKHGDAITAAHVVITPDELPAGKRFVAVVQLDGKETVCWVNRAAWFGDWDFALIHINIDNNKYLKIDSSVVHSGSDVVLVGIPDHEVWGAGKEMRILKGHVTMSHKHLELNIPIPKGMSGAPVWNRQKVVGFATGMVRTEEIEDSSESVQRISDTKEQIVITEKVSAIFYGLACPFSKVANVPLPALEGQTLVQFIDAQNAAKS